MASTPTWEHSRRFHRRVNVSILSIDAEHIAIAWRHSKDLRIKDGNASNGQAHFLVSRS
jgi:hypothetical protein